MRRSNGKWPFAVMAAMALAGCNATSDGDGDDDNDQQVSLSAEDRAAGAAMASAGQFLDLSGQAQSQATATVGDDGGPSSRTTNGRDTTFNCDGAVEASIDARFDTRTTDVFSPGNLTWDGAFDNRSGFPDSDFDSDDYAARVNCVLEDSNGNEFARYIGAYDILQKTDIDSSSGSLIHATAGGLGDTDPLSFDTDPDMTDRFEVYSNTAAGTMQFDMRYQLQQCSGCVAGDLGNWGGDPDRDITSASFLEMDMTLSGTRTQIQAGTPTEPFVFSSVPDSGDRADITLNGRLQFGGDSGCGYDVTLGTPSGQSILFSEMSTDPTPVSGEMSVEDHDSGQTFTITFTNGEPTVRDQNDTVLTPDTDNIEQCGFL